MVRFSDIFKKPKEEPAKQEPVIKQEPAKEKPPQEVKSNVLPVSISAIFPKARQASPKEPAGTQAVNPMHIAKAMEGVVSDKARARDLYMAGIGLIKEALLDAEELRPINLPHLKQWVDDLTECLIFSDSELLTFVYEYVSENYLHSHMVNAAIIAVEIGLGLGYNKSQLHELGLAGLLHDIGMIKAGKLDTQSRKLTEEEYSRIKAHPVYGVEILSKIKDISESVIYVAKEEHERVNGAGYPNGLKNGQISEYARIIMIVDVYDALTHDRPYRKRISPHEAIKELIANTTLFDPLILRVLINKVGVYPVSSWVELNSNEIGKVIINDSEYPLRPTVHVLFDTAGHRLREPHAVNLVKQFNLFVKKVLSSEDLAKIVKEPIEA